ncbi:MAG: porin [Pseudomonadota bacterium]
MKKILFTSTALVASAGIAAAEVKITGSAKMGIAEGGEFHDGGLSFFQDVDVTFTMSGETDGGLAFGVSVDLDEAQDDIPLAGTDENDAFDDTSEDGGVAVFISGGLGTLTMGDTDGAMDWALTEGGNVNNPGTLRDDETAYEAYRGSYLDGVYDGQVVRYDNTFGDFGVALSFEMDDAGDNDPGYALGVKYNLELGGTTIALGAGYQTATQNIAGTPVEATAIGLSATATLFDGLSAGLGYTLYEDVDGAGIDASHIQLGVGYKIGALGLHANYSDYDSDSNVFDEDGFGLAASYDLGGGAAIHAGYGVNETEDDIYSLGLAMSF